MKDFLKEVMTCMTDYTLNKQIPLTSVQNNVVEFMLQRPACINACQTGL